MRKMRSLWCPLCHELVAGFGRSGTIGQMAQHIASKHPELAEGQKETLARRPWQPRPLADALAYPSVDHGPAHSHPESTVWALKRDEEGRGVRELLTAIATNAAAVPAMLGFVALGGIVLAGRAVAERHSRKQNRSNLTIAVPSTLPPA